jgi:Methionyl-tRNA formyltransferase
VTIMQMDAGLDTGDMLLMERIPIGPHDTTGSLQDNLAGLGARLVVEAVELAACGGLKPVPQSEVGVTYARKIDKAEAAIDWSRPAGQIERRVRAFNPVPGAAASIAGETLKLWRCEVEASEAGGARPGTVLRVDAAGVVVACGEGALRLTELQRPGGKRLEVAEFLRGFDLKPGMSFEQRS